MEVDNDKTDPELEGFPELVNGNDEDEDDEDEDPPKLHVPPRRSARIKAAVLQKGYH